MIRLSLEPLDKALASLKRGLARLSGVPDDEEVRDACIQRFEYCFELAYKTMKRRLEMDEMDARELDGMSFKGVLRLALEHRLIATVEPWVDFRELRNITSHVYDLDKARQVTQALPRFVDAAESLLVTLIEREQTDES